MVNRFIVVLSLREIVGICPLMLQFLHICYRLFVFIRFLGNEVFDLSGLIVSVRREVVPQVKFFKSPPQECQNCELLCKVTMRRTSRVSTTSDLVNIDFAFVELLPIHLLI